EAVGDPLEPAHGLVELHALDAAHRVEERHETEPRLASRRFLPQVVLEGRELDAAQRDSGGQQRDQDPPHLLARAVEVDEDGRPRSEARSVHFAPRRGGACSAKNASSLEAPSWRSSNAVANESRNVPGASKPSPGTTATAFSSSSFAPSASVSGSAFDRQRETSGNT